MEPTPPTPRPRSAAQSGPTAPEAQEGPNAAASRRALPLLLWLLWGVLLAGWTFALLRPVPPEVHTLGTPTLRFYAAKGLHLSAYASLACVACWLPARRGARAAAWSLLLLHAALTEYGQTFVGRGGSVADVALDSAGVLIGVGAGLAGGYLRRAGRGAALSESGVAPPRTASRA